MRGKEEKVAGLGGKTSAGLMWRCFWRFGLCKALFKDSGLAAGWCLVGVMAAALVVEFLSLIGSPLSGVEELARSVLFFHFEGMELNAIPQAWGVAIGAWEGWAALFAVALAQRVRWAALGLFRSAKKEPEGIWLEQKAPVVFGFVCPIGPALISNWRAGKWVCEAAKRSSSGRLGLAGQAAIGVTAMMSLAVLMLDALAAIFLTALSVPLGVIILTNWEESSGNWALMAFGSVWCLAWARQGGPATWARWMISRLSRAMAAAKMRRDFNFLARIRPVLQGFKCKAFRAMARIADSALARERLTDQEASRIASWAIEGSLGREEKGSDALGLALRAIQGAGAVSGIRRACAWAKPAGPTALMWAGGLAMTLTPDYFFGILMPWSDTGLFETGGGWWALAWLAFAGRWIGLGLARSARDLGPEWNPQTRGVGRHALAPMAPAWASTMSGLEAFKRAWERAERSELGLAGQALALLGLGMTGAVIALDMALMAGFVCSVPTLLIDWMAEGEWPQRGSLILAVCGVLWVRQGSAWEVLKAGIRGARSAPAKARLASVALASSKRSLGQGLLSAAARDGSLSEAERDQLSQALGKAAEGSEKKRAARRL